MTIDQIAERLHAKSSGTGYVAKCPAHDDHRSSLSIGIGHDGRILLKCHTGCDVEAIVSSAGLTIADLFTEKSVAKNTSNPRIAATYDYTDEAGALLYQVVRLLPKDFRQRAPDGAGGWIWKLGHVRRVLFALPSLRGQEEVYICEGEKDAIRLQSLGLIATTNAGGAGKGKWLSDYTAQLVASGARRVYVLPDRDDVGRQHGEIVAASCSASGLDARVVVLPIDGKGADVSDYLKTNTINDLIQLARDAPLWRAPTPAAEKQLAFIRNENGAIVKDHQGNIALAVQSLDFTLSYHLFAEKTLITNCQGPSETLSDHNLDSLWLRIDSECRFRPTFIFFEKVVNNIARKHAFHPVRDYLNSLAWDGHSRIYTWLRDYGGAIDTVSDSSEDRSYLETVSSIVLIAAVKRARYPGCKYDEMLVLESQQGLNKSSALRALCPDDDWFSDDLPLNVDSKQIIERTLGKWIIEASDLVGGRKADRDHLKAMLSRQRDGPARLAYAHIPIERPRQFVIIGTTNADSYLADTTGARRFWPVKVQEFNVAAIIRDRDQLWAEAAHREAAGELIRMPKDLWAHAGEHQEARREIDAWEDAIEAKLETLPPSVSSEPQRIATDALWGALSVRLDQRDRAGAKRISEIMQRLGWARTVIRVGVTVQRGYQRTRE